MPRPLLLVCLGLCEHCNAIVSIEDMPSGSMDAKWSCPACKKGLAHKSFGYAEDKNSSTGFKRARWVGPGGKWVDKKPTEDFIIGELEVMVRF